jgi:hypothetical protein
MERSKHFAGMASRRVLMSGIAEASSVALSVVDTRRVRTWVCVAIMYVIPSKE